MHMEKTLLLTIAVTISSSLLLGCGSSPTKDQPSGATLADIDVSQRGKSAKKKNTKKKSQEEIRQAYRTYVESASSHDSSRQKALTRLAQLELELSNSLHKDSESQQDQEDSQDISKSLQRTITLLETTLKDYPKAKGNDSVLYQLAQAYDRAGFYQKSIARLHDLATRYPTSLHYPEAQFRVAEAAFARGDYITAEDAYTEVILTPGSDKFYEKSLFKRGWTRYKQQLYLESMDDYIDAIDYHNFGDYSSLVDADKTQFDEYLRALALAFSYHGGEGTIKEFFASKSEFKYVYETYAMVSDIYLKQERYSDAAIILEEFASFNQNNPKTPQAELKIIAAWEKGGFSQRFFEAIEAFYTRYQPKASYWSKVQNDTIKKSVQEQLRQYITQISAYYHERYQNKNKPADYSRASTWYERYLDHYTSHANQDKIYTLYGELLLKGQHKEKALGYFSLAAFDGDLILDKKAAYSAIVLSANLVDQRPDDGKMLGQHLGYAQRFIELYPKDERSQNIATSAAERAFHAKSYETVINIVNYVSDSANEKVRFNANNLKARAFLELAQYADAEAVYLELLDVNLSKRKQQKSLQNSLALAIYRQGEAAQKENQIDMALNHFTRIIRIIPESTLASTGLYDAIALSMQHEQWNQAIALIEEFKQRYPKHKNTADVTKKLSVAYLKSNQQGKAAKEFERIAQFEDNLELKMAALWQAAQLYESKNNIDSAIRAYREYAHTYKTPYEPYMESMYKLSKFYKQQGQTQKRHFWQTRIRRADRKATKRNKTERTTFIASTTTLDLARQKMQEFEGRKLVEPLAKNLKLKKSAMQESVKLFGQASAYGMQEITTEATFSIGDIYKSFSQSLLDSERPSNLNEEELEQYEILLEDQAFPFEEKAIEFYETNLARTQDDTYDQWIEKSFQELLVLFPVRYQRKGKTHVYEAN